MLVILNGEKTQLRENERHPGKTEEPCSAVLLPAPTSLPQQSRSVMQSLVGILVRAASLWKHLKRVRLQHREGNEVMGYVGCGCRRWA